MMRIESWRDDIELAIASYVDDMNPELYAALSASRPDFLRDHNRFGEDITEAVDRLERMLSILTYIPGISDFLFFLICHIDLPPF